METGAEVARIRAAYQEYSASRVGQSKWSGSNPGNQALRAERDSRSRELLQEAGVFPLSQRRILDLGCGTGEQLGTFLGWGAQPENLFGFDLLPERIEAAQQRFPRILFEIGNAESLPYADGAFDLVAVFTVFTSILDRGMAANIGSEINRTLVPGGAVLWYDLRRNNPFNQHIRGMSRGRVEQLFPGFEVALETISLLPPLARRLGSLTARLYHPLAALPFLRTHLLGLLTKPRVHYGLI